jgi:hypothetical protein
MENHVKIANLSAPWIIANAEHLVLQALQFH